MLTRRRFMGVSVGLGAGSAFGFETLGCGSSRNTNEWLVGAYLSLSGTDAEFGKDTQKGIDLAVEEINKDPPKGKKIKIQYEDDESNATKANNKVLQLIDRDKVVALLGEVASSISRPCGIVANNNKIPMISPSSTNPNVTETGPYVFRVCFTDDFQGHVGADFIVKTLGKKKIGLLFAADDLYSSGLADWFKKAVKELGAEIVLEKSFPKTETKFSTYIEEMRGAKPDVIYAPIYYSDMIPLAKEAKEKGIPGDMFVGADGWSNAELYKILDGAYFTDHYAPDIRWEKSKQFVAAYKAKYNETPVSLAACGYDAALVLADAIRRSKADTPPSFRDAIAETKDFVGATGKITIDENRNAQKPIVVVQITGGTTTFKDAFGPGADAILGGAKPPPPDTSATPASASPATSASAAPSASANAAPAPSASSMKK